MSWEIKSTTPSLKLTDESTATQINLQNSAGDLKVVDASGNEVTINGVKITAHASRHDRGGADALDWTSISRLVDSGDVSCAVGTGGSASATTVYSLPANWTNIIPLAVYMEVGGTVASSETVSITVKAVLDDGSEYEIASYSVTGTTGSKTESAPFANLLASLRSAGVTKDGNRITSIVAEVSSSATSTSATATVRVIGVRT